MNIRYPGDPQLLAVLEEDVLEKVYPPALIYFLKKGPTTYEPHLLPAQQNIMDSIFDIKDVHSLVSHLETHDQRIIQNALRNERIPLSHLGLPDATQETEEPVDNLIREQTEILRTEKEEEKNRFPVSVKDSRRSSWQKGCLEAWKGGWKVDAWVGWLGSFYPQVVTVKHVALGGFRAWGDI